MAEVTEKYVTSSYEREKDGGTEVGLTINVFLFLFHFHWTTYESLGVLNFGKVVGFLRPRHEL